MKKLAISIVLTIAMAAALAGCDGVSNKQWIDTTYSFNKAIVSLPDGRVITGDVQSWTDYEDGDQIQVKIDGVTYLVHSTNAVLINE